MGQLMNIVLLGGLAIGGYYIWQNPSIIDDVVGKINDFVGGIGGGKSSGDTGSTDSGSTDSGSTDSGSTDKTTTCKSGEYMSTKQKKCVKTPTCKSGQTFDEATEKCAKPTSGYAYAYLSTPTIRRVTGINSFYERPRIIRR